MEEQMRAPAPQTLYAENADYVAQSLRRLGVAPGAVEDLTHDVFLAALTRLASYDPRRPLRPWLFGFAFREASAWRNRAARLREVHGDVPDVSDGRETIEAELMRSQNISTALQALAALEPDRKAVFILHDIDEQSVPEIAAALEVPLNTAYSRLRLARRDFNTAFARLQRAEERA